MSTVAELNRRLALVRWADAVAAAPEDEFIDPPEGYSYEELLAALFLAIYHSRRQSPAPLVAGGQGRTDKEITISGESSIKLFFVILALMTFVGLCFYFR